MIRHFTLHGKPICGLPRYIAIEHGHILEAVPSSQRFQKVTDTCPHCEKLMVDSYKDEDGNFEADTPEWVKERGGKDVKTEDLFD